MVVSITDTTGVNRARAEVNCILHNKFDPLNLSKLHPDSEGFEDTGSSDTIVLVNEEMRSRQNEVVY